MKAESVVEGLAVETSRFVGHSKTDYGFAKDFRDQRSRAISRQLMRHFQGTRIRYIKPLAQQSYIILGFDVHDWLSHMGMREGTQHCGLSDMRRALF